MKSIRHSFLLAVFFGLLTGPHGWAASSELAYPASVRSAPTIETRLGEITAPLPTVAALETDGIAALGALELTTYGNCSREPACGCGSAVGCGAGVGGAPKPWSIPQPCCLQDMGIRLGGWLEQGITFNGDNPADSFNGPLATNDLDSEYQMNQMWLYLDRAADNQGEGWAVGGHVDMMYGTDWRFGINHGLEDRINGFNDQTYGTVIPQAYVEIAYNRLSVKLGHFAAILDYEVVPAIFNPFYSHSYSYAYTVPQLVSGMIGNYQLTDEWSVQAGFTRGWSMFEDYNDDLDFMGGIKWQSSDKQSSLAWAMNTGAQDFIGPSWSPYRTSGENNRFVYSLVAKQQLSKKLQYILVHNLGIENDMPTGPNTAADAEWYGVNQYLLYAINPTLQANLRAEWMRDDDGARIAGPGNITGVRAWNGAGFAGNFYEVTAGLIWRPHTNIIVRPEVRWDWYDGLESPLQGIQGRGALPFDNGSDDDQFTVGTDVIFTF